MQYARVTKIITALLVGICLAGCASSTKEKGPAILKKEDFKHYVEYFNRMEDENIQQAIPNEDSWEWMKANVPLFEAPQKNFEEIFYYRWWTLRKHIKETPVGYAMTEFLVERSYSDKYNLISCALGHHIYESRWLHNPKYLDGIVHTWYRGNDGKPMKKLDSFSSWTANALYNRFLVTGDSSFIIDMLPDLVAEYENWEKNRQRPDGLFWQIDVKDGMEESISGGRHVENVRPTINSYMYGNAKAIAKIARMKGDEDLAKKYEEKAEKQRERVHKNLWNQDRLFFETVKEEGGFAEVREAIGFIPWYFNLPKDENPYHAAWDQVTDQGGFMAPFGLTTAECRHPEFRTHGCCNCEWDGAVWPFATSQTLTAMANLFNNYDQSMVDEEDYFHHMNRYVESQYYRGRPYIGEYLDEKTGFWLKGDEERSRYYNHSTFNDMIITGLVGFRPRADEKIEVNPLVPEGKWDWFCLDNVKYEGDILTIFWDKTGEKYNKGKGLHVLINGKEIASSENLERIVAKK
ncbi:trehalase family glycosidase [Echinicola jeungdonensis]|uniref:Glycosyl hydrolase family 65 protein n=1 Tax=Echinicola jeungdonensis TaxID=709343 RepID=A0ABV5J424_9BACT|nr:glycosyl hydrolase family 65 protein [Echinicola jeungdonensis]MDN3669368.1 trehalase family glycosidase [Echinicola jeungdonensis]